MFARETQATRPNADNVVVVGGGQAAASCINRLGEFRFEGNVTLIGEEPFEPYDRTVLSKSALLGTEFNAPSQLIKSVITPPQGLVIRTDLVVDRINVADHVVRTSSGESFSYGKLLIATGSEPRRIQIPGVENSGVHYLRDVADTTRLRADLVSGGEVVVIGGGVIGLEVAASARAVGCSVTIVEMATTILGRYLPTEIAAAVHEIHERQGVTIRTGESVVQIHAENDRVTGVELGTKEILPASVVVIGVGVVPRDLIAREAGIDTDDGILVNNRCVTSDSDVFAAGDVARLISGGDLRGTRTESWQAAGRQGETVAANLLGLKQKYDDILWTWSDQYDAVLQTAGTCNSSGDRIVCGDVDQRNGLLVVATRDGLIDGVAGVSYGSGIGKAVRAAQIVMQHNAPIDTDLLRAMSSDAKSVMQLLTSAARGAMAAA